VFTVFAKTPVTDPATGTTTEKVRFPLFALMAGRFLGTGTKDTDKNVGTICSWSTGSSGNQPIHFSCLKFEMFIERNVFIYLAGFS
jgi:hypothetical protein